MAENSIAWPFSFGHKSQQMGYQEKKRDKMTKNDPAMIYNTLPILPTHKKRSFIEIKSFDQEVPV